MRFTIPGVLVILIIAAATAHAGMFDDMNFTGTFESVYWDHDPDDWNAETGSNYEGPYKSLENNLSLNIDWKQFFAEIRLRTMDYENGIHYDERSREHETDFELFKATAGYRSDYLTVIAGDFYKSLARGLVLYVQEDKELNLDRTIRGGMASYTSSYLDVTAFGGEIRWYKFHDHLSDMTSDVYRIKDEVYGGQLVGKFPMDIHIGLNFNASKVYEIIQEEYQSEDVNLGSVNFEMNGALNGKLDLYSEYAEQRWDSDQPFGEDRDDGTALYSSATVYAGPFTFLAEYKDYDYWDYRYSRPPTADRDDEQSETDDIKGGRLKVDYYINSTGTLFYVSYGKFNNHAHEGSYGKIVRNEIEHTYLGIEQTWSKLYAHVTWGYKDFSTLGEIHRRVTGDFVYNLTDTQSLNYYYEFKNTSTALASKDEHEMYLTYSLSPWVTLTAHYNRHVMDTVNSPSESQEWWAGEIGLTPISALSLSVIYGELPPGLLCSGGQCRIVPEFDGIQASLTYRF